MAIALPEPGILGHQPYRHPRLPDESFLLEDNCVGIISHDKINLEQKSEQGSEVEAAEVLDTEVEAVTRPERTKAKTAKKQAKATAKPEARNCTQNEKKDMIGLLRLIRKIPDEAAAVRFVEEAIWGDTPQCGHCGSDNVYGVDSGKPQPWRCRSCKKYFSVKVGTVMEKSLLPMQTWVLAIHLMHTSRKGMSAKQLSKMLDIQHRTAWFLCHRIREAMNQDDVVLRGIVQGDETFMGGSLSNMHTKNKPPKQLNERTGKYYRSWKANKHTVIGLRNHHGHVLAFHMPDDSASAVREKLMKHVPPGEVTLWTDSSGLYRNLSSLGYDHETVNHNEGEYVRDETVTTNAIESFFALVKRGYNGTFHFMSEQHLHRYMNEFAFRYTLGEGNGVQTISTVLKRTRGERLTYKGLTRRKLHGPKLSEIGKGWDKVEPHPIPLPLAA